MPIAPYTPASTCVNRIKGWIANRGTTRFDIFQLGDSISNFGALSLEGGLGAKFSRKFNAMYPTNGLASSGGVVGYGQHFSADYAYDHPNPVDAEPEREGVPTKQKTRGLGLQGHLQSGGTTRFKTTKCTSAGIMIYRMKTNDTYRIYVDGTLVRTVTSGPEKKWVEERVTGLAYADHVIRIEFVNNNLPCFDAIVRYAGNETKGFFWWDGCRSGASTGMYTKEGPGQTYPAAAWAEELPLCSVDGKSGPKLVIITLGTNDYGVTKAAFKKLVRDIIAAIRPYLAADAIIMLSLPQVPYFDQNGTWAGYEEAQHEVAAEEPNVYVAPISRYIGKQQSDGATQWDPLHPSEDGYDNYVDVLMNYITGNADIPTTNPGSGGGTPPTTGDTTPPVCTSSSPAAGVTVAYGATQAFTYTASDASGLTSHGVFGDFGNGDIRVLGTGTAGANDTYTLALPWSKLVGIQQWRAAARDSGSNELLTYSDWRAIAAAAAPAEAAVKPVITDITPISGSALGGSFRIRAKATHSSGMETVVVYSGTTFIDELQRVAGTDYYESTFLIGAFPETASSFAILAKSVAKTSLRSDPVLFTRTADVDRTPPSGQMTSPLPGTALSGTVPLRATAIDTDSGVAFVEFYANDSLKPFASGSNRGNNSWGADITFEMLPADTTTIRARLTDRENNGSWTPAIAVTVVPVEDDVYLVAVDAKSLLPADQIVRDAWIEWMSDTLSAGGDGGALIARDPDTGRLYDPTITD